MAQNFRMYFLVIFVIVPFFLLTSLSYFPLIWIHIFMTVDYLTPWVAFESPFYLKYHEYLVSRLPERPEIPIPFLDSSNFSVEAVKRLGKDYTFPVVIKGLASNASGVKKWGDHKWWVDNFGDEEILCGTLDAVRLSCTVKDFFSELEAGNAFYISGASKIFTRHPELADMVDTPEIKSIDPAPRTATQIFMGVKDMGSDIHCATGINIFRQITGVKKWWFIPPSQTAYLLPSINVNGFSAHTHTLVGKSGEQMSPWMSKLERYTATLTPGDVLINPPWFWHGILNVGDRKDLVIGVPTRYGGKEGLIAAFKSNWYMTMVSVLTRIKGKITGSGDQKGVNDNDILEERIQQNRLARMKSPN